MRTTIAPETVDRFREDGFCVVPDFLDTEELAIWRKEVVTAIEDLEAKGNPNSATGDAQIAKLPPEHQQRMLAMREQFSQYQHVARQYDSVMRLIDDDGLRSMVATLVGKDKATYLGDQAMFKAPFAAPTFLHYDKGPKWPVPGDSAVTIWVALEDADARNGCLYYLPGTHKMELLNGSGERLGAIIERNPQLAGIDPVPCEVKAGSAVMHSGLTVHGSGANMTSKPRPAFSFTMAGH